MRCRWQNAGTGRSQGQRRLVRVPANRGRAQLSIRVASAGPAGAAVARGARRRRRVPVVACLDSVRSGVETPYTTTQGTPKMEHLAKAFVLLLGLALASGLRAELPPLRSEER